jgi:hypothetical protein
MTADFSPDGTRLVAVSQTDGQRYYFLLPDIGSLRAELWKQSAGCPDARTRVDLLGQPQAEAERDYRACRVRKRADDP